MNEAIYRGNGKSITARDLNPISDLEDLFETEKGAEGEPDKLVLKVNGQITWFRSKNGKGLIETEKVSADEEAAEYTAKVYNDAGQYLGNATGTATYEDDGVRGFKLKETAETRAVGRALSRAGYGCQVNLGYMDDLPATPPNGPRGRNDDNIPDGGKNNSQLPMQDNPPAAGPGTIDGKMVVQKKTSAVVDVKDDGQQVMADVVGGKPRTTPASSSQIGAVEEKKPTATVSKGNEPKQKQEEPAAKPVLTPAASKKVTEIPAANVPESPAAISDKAESAVPTRTETTTAPIAASQPVSVQKSVTEHATEEELTVPTAEKSEKTGEPKASPAVSSSENGVTNIIRQLIEKQFDSIKANQTEIKNDYFTAGDVDNSGKYINHQQVATFMDAMQLQHAITIIEGISDGYKHIVVPIHKTSEMYGKTYGEIFDDPDGKNLIAAICEMYRKEDVLGFAAALICQKEHQLTLVESIA